MSITIFGSNGQLGQSLASICDEADIQFNQYSRNEVDITRPNTISKIDIPSIIINAAAYTDVDMAEENSKKAFQVNELGVKNISLYCRTHNIPLVHISTDFVFNGLSHIPYVESDSVNPINIYGKSKLAGEIAIQKYCPRYLILRTSWVFSEFGSNFLKTMLNMSDKKVVNVIDNLYGTPTDANQLSKAILSLIPLIRKSDFKSKTLHFASQEPMSWFEFASIIFDEASKTNRLISSPRINPISFEEYSLKAARPINTSLNSSDFFELTKFKHPSLRDTLARAIKRIVIE